jgi:hypothetical protein
MPRRALPLALTVAVAATPAAVAAPRGPAPRPTVVVAVADTGVNPYHAAFYRPRNTAHPCTYVAGFDCRVPALRLSVGKYTDYAKAVAADRAVWDSVVPGRWYWIPGTNIIGAVCDAPFDDIRDPAPEGTTCILDDNGHGTATASSVLSESPDALLLVHEGNTAAAALATVPVLPDVQSHSWGPPAPMPKHLAGSVTGDDPTGGCGPVRRRESLFFTSAGNEEPFPAILDCERAPLDVHIVGGGYPGYWTPWSWTTMDFASWFCRPAAISTAVTGTEEWCGTSFSAPTAAGTAAEALLRLRRQDGYAGRSTNDRVSRTVTRAAFERALREGATYTPKDRYPGGGPLCTSYVLCVVDAVPFGRLAPLPEQAPYVFWGYGWLDATVVPAIVGCARGRDCPAKPAEATRWNDARNAARAPVDGPLLAAGPQDDAGARRDAGDDRAGALRVAAGREYAGRLEPFGMGGDLEDWYALPVAKGQRISIASVATLHPGIPADVYTVAGCWYVVAPDGRSLDADRAVFGVHTSECESTPGDNPPPKDLVAPATGTYVLVYTAPNAQPAHDYTFTVTVSG